MTTTVHKGSTRSITVAPRERFATVARSTLLDERLGFRAKGLLVWLLDKPDGWRTTIDRIAEVGPDGEYAVRSALRELEECGYLVRRKSRTEAGTIDWEWTVNEVSPHAEIAPGPERGNRADPSAKTAVNPSAKTAVLRETERTERDVERDSALPSLPPEFDRFWALYPRRTGKGAARIAYAKAREKVSFGHLMQRVLDFANDPNRESGFTPHPATWLNQERWDDDPLPSKSKPESAGMKLIRRAAAMTNGAHDGNGDDDPGAPRKALGALPRSTQRR